MEKGGEQAENPHKGGSQYVLVKKVGCFISLPGIKRSRREKLSSEVVGRQIQDSRF